MEQSWALAGRLDMDRFGRMMDNISWSKKAALDGRPFGLAPDLFYLTRTRIQFREPFRVHFLFASLQVVLVGQDAVLKA